jgi:hypothetical protein
MIGNIFQKAKDVYVWVGPGDSDSDLAMDFYKRLLRPGFFHQIKERWSQEYGFIALGKPITKAIEEGDGDGGNTQLDGRILGLRS